MPERPNVLFLLSDQQRADCLGAVNPHIKTPHLDRLAREGQLFHRAYPPTPVCLPCRAALISGQYPSTNRAMHNSSPLNPPAVTTAGVFREAGYATTMIGKSHLNGCHAEWSMESAPHIHNRDWWRQFEGPWYGFERARLAIGHSTEAHACGMHYGVWLEERGIDTDKYFGNTGYYDYGTWDLPEEVHSSKWMADETIDMIDRSVEEGRPFFATVNFQDPHNPCYAPEPWASMYDPEEIPTFGFKEGEPESFDNKPPIYKEVLERPGEYTARYSHPQITGAFNASALPYSQEDTQKNAAIYYGMVSLMDKHIGRILDHLDKTGLADNTIVVFASDHGDFLGDHGIWWKQIFTYEEALRVPLIVRWPKGMQAGVESQSLVNLLDLPVTWMEAAGIEVPPDFEGVNQLPVWTGDAEKVRDVCVVEDQGGQTFAQRIIMDDRYKLAAYNIEGWGELYDMAEDPDHLVNLYDDPVHRETRDRLLMKLLHHEMTQTHPTGPREGVHRPE